MNGTDNPNPRAPAVWGSIWTLFGIAAFTVVLRFKARNIRRLPWEMDDYAVLVALVCCALRKTLEMLNELHAISRMRSSFSPLELVLAHHSVRFAVCFSDSGSH